ncbi:MAG: AIM24 family protein [Solirubrobacterales bacterium]
MSARDGLAGRTETEGGAFSLQNSKMLKVELADVTVQAKLGSMVAYQGDVGFEAAGSGGMKKMLKKAVTKEGTDLMKISGSGEVFLADEAQDIQILQLSEEAITANGANVLAFDAGIDWDIKRVEGLSGMMGGGRYNMELKGSGYVALVSVGSPVLIELDGSNETYADPQAAITWSGGVKTSLKTDVKLTSIIRGGSGEELQMALSGSGWILIQPSEGVTKGAATAAGGGSSSGSSGAAQQLGNLLGGR